jgi:ATPase subunit of ABC transporter with duplicated ATPase domains
MPFLRAHAISFAFGGSRSLFSNLSFQLDTGFTALVGENGAGKTTLLRLIARLLSPSFGHLQDDCAQRLLVEQQSPLEQPNIDHALNEPAFHKLVGQLQLDLDTLERWPTLSFGEKKRWQIALALSREPHLLLLDEPSNHLDAEGREWLVAALQRFRGIGIIVSHDRALLDTLCSNTLRLAGDESRIWRGNYSHARASWEQEKAERLEQKLVLRQQRDHAAKKLADARREHHSAELSRSTARRMKDPNDSDARGIMQQSKADRAAARQGRRVEVLRRAHTRAKDNDQRLTLKKEVGLDSVWIGHEPSPRPVLLEHGGHVVGRTDRIRIAGRNGAGKTTLIRTMLATSRLPTDRVLYLPQEMSAAEGAAVLNELKVAEASSKGHAFAVIAALGLDPEHALESSAPSPGEVRKLMLGLALARKAWLLVLDEPTNHLDLPSIERLEKALAQWPGALLLVTHDDQLAARCTTATWRVPLDVAVSHR